MNVQPKIANLTLCGQNESFADGTERARTLPTILECCAEAYVASFPVSAMVFGVLGVLLSGIALLGALCGAAPGSSVALLTGASALLGTRLFLLLGLNIITCLLCVGGGYLMRQRMARGWWMLALAFAVGMARNFLTFSIGGCVFLLLCVWMHAQVAPRYQ